MQQNFLLEIGVEELPVSYIESAIFQLENLIKKMLEDNRLYNDDIDISVKATPRRLVVFIKNLPNKQKEKVIFIKGPAVKFAYNEKSEQQIPFHKFAEKFKENTIYIGVYEQGEKYRNVNLENIKDGFLNNKYIFAGGEKEEKNTNEILKIVLPQLISSLKFPKLMRWEAKNIKFARPIRWILCLLENEIINFKIGEIESSNYSYGHRFLSNNQKIFLNSSDEYFEKLKNAFVIIDQNQRKNIIKKSIQEIVNQINGKILLNEDLLNTTTFLTEYPSALLGNFQEKYLSLPKDIIVTCLEEYQQYFSVIDENNNLKPYFISIVNNDTTYLDIIRQGNERVLEARLSDADFYFQKDIEIPFKEREEKLKNIVWLEKLGTIEEKIKRMENLSVWFLQETENMFLSEKVKELIKLCKLDLTTTMITEKEFSKLQGIIGREYAIFFKIDEEIANGIFEHYLPRFTNDKLPSYFSSAIVSILDKIDSLVGCFIAGFIPTGTEDPYGCRRYARAIIEVILEKKIKINVYSFLEESIETYKEKIKIPSENLLNNLNKFLLERFRLFLEENFSYDIVRSVLLDKIENIVIIWNKINYLDKVKNEKDFQEIIVSFSRVFNILNGKKYQGFDVNLLEEPAEKSLYEQFESIKQDLEKNLICENYFSLMELFFSLKKPIDTFFNNVLVMVEDEKLKNNRLGLLTKLSSEFLKFADFSKISKSG
ncbi:MAG: glycine--tRNA ligase subunit beta [bacterium]